jgi:hypothetical protein
MTGLFCSKASAVLNWLQSVNQVDFLFHYDLPVWQVLHI